MAESFKPTRKEIAEVFKEPRMIKAIERLFDAVTSSEEIVIDIQVLSAMATAIENSAQIANLQSELTQALLTPPREVDYSFPYIKLKPNVKVYMGEEGVIKHSDEYETIEVSMLDGVIQKVGMNNYYFSTNETGSTVSHGTCVGFNGVSGTTDKIKMIPYIADGSISSLYMLGVVTFPSGVANNESGYVTFFGRVSGLNTSSFSQGDILYASPSTAGAFTNVKPTAPDLSIPVAAVLKSDSTEGEIFVRPTLEQELFYGVFSKTSSATAGAINTAESIELDSTEISLGVSLDGGNPERIVFSHSGLYMVTVTFQLSSSSSSLKNGWFWVAKNGTDITNSSTISSLASNSEYKTTTRSWVQSFSSSDYLELKWAVDDTALTLTNVAATAFAPASPSVIVNVTMIQQ